MITAIISELQKADNIQIFSVYINRPKVPKDPKVHTLPNFQITHLEYTPHRYPDHHTIDKQQTVKNKCYTNSPRGTNPAANETIRLMTACVIQDTWSLSSSNI